ncbi:hypothetical protein MASR2M44_21300 [Bacteroidota bacterium]
MTTLFDYCIQNKEALLNYKQEAFSWRSRYNEDTLLEIPNFKKVAAEIPSAIDRSHIVCTIQRGSYYQAFAEILLWGQIGARPRSNKSKKTEIAGKALKYEETKIQMIFKTVSSGHIDEIKKLYASLENKSENKIEEVGISYFTKILAFASEASSTDFKLLIYDKWTRLIHAHLLFDLKQAEKLKLYYTENELRKIVSVSKNTKKVRTTLIHPKSSESCSAYMNFCTEMDALSKKISAAVGESISAFHLEAFLFGVELRLKGRQNELNPRYWIQTNFAKKYLQLI